ncbi:MAG TPA: SUMF1/EgtB/PvdO family nonheme iron enzyme [Armatimonadota bacterium]|nr:SUMF1/EgtB/PvdO family nonheme iron enzyme [Armatimonadota bacterium]
MRCGREAFGLAKCCTSLFLAGALIVGMMVLPGCGCGGETPGGIALTYGEVSLVLAWPTAAAPAGAVSLPRDTELVRIRAYAGGTPLASYEGEAFPREVHRTPGQSQATITIKLPAGHIRVEAEALSAVITAPSTRALLASGWAEFEMAAKTSEGQPPTAIALQVSMIAPRELNALVTVDAGQPRVRLTWAAPDSPGVPVLGYRVYRSANAGGATGSEALLDVVNGTQYTDPDPAEGARHYAVTALYQADDAATADADEAIESPPCPEVVGSVTAVPPPIGLSAVASSNRVDLTWVEPADTSNVAGYAIYRSVTSGSGYTRINATLVAVGTTTYADTTAANGVPYFYVARSVAPSGQESANSNEATATPEAGVTVIPPPHGLAAVGSSSRVDLTWVEPSDTSNVAGYAIYRSLTSGSGYTRMNAALVAVGTATYADTTVTNGTPYYYVVRSVAPGGQESANSNEASATPEAGVTVIPPPHGLAAVGSSNRVDLTWVEPSDTSNVAGYAVYRTLESGRNYTRINAALVAVGTATYADTTVTNGTPYYYVVRSVAPGGQESANSNEASATPEAGVTVVPPPRNLTATGGNGRVDLQWTAPTSTSGISGYAVYRSTTSGSGYTRVNATLVAVGTNAYADTTVTNGTPYYYVVRSVAPGGQESANSNEAQATPQSGAVSVPAPSGLSAVGGNGRVDLAWSEPANTSGVAGYAVYRSVTSGTGYSRINSSLVGVGTHTYADTTVTNGTPYYYVVRSVAPGGQESANSNQATATPRAAFSAWIINPKDSSMKLIGVAAGPAVFGANDGAGTEQPQFTATLPAYYIGETEVTNAQYARFLTDAKPSSGTLATWIELRTDAWMEIQKSGDTYTPVAGRENHPVVFVSWHGAKAYCDWAGLRLPTELEWEKGARGTDGREYPWGGSGYLNGWDSTKCRNQTNQAAYPPAGTCEVFDYAAGISPMGLYNTSGDVWEWRADWFGGCIYSQYATGDLTPPSTGTGRVLRGGGWDQATTSAFRCATRGFIAPEDTHSYVGFRCAASP